MRLVDGQEGCVHTRHLACSDSDRCAVARNHDCIRLHGSHSSPREHEILALVISGWSLADNSPAGELSDRRGSLLQQQPSAHSLVVERVRSPISMSLENAKILLASKNLQRFVAESRSDDTF